ncbi:hypothetical protein GCM10028772_17200 [Nocardioides ultimimeridianus]
MSRTASGKWKATRARVIRRARVAAREAGHPEWTACALCSRPVYFDAPWKSHGAAQVDHVVSPLDRPDLEFVLSNLRVAHRSCNASRGRPGHARRVERRSAVDSEPIRSSRDW